MSVLYPLIQALVLFAVAPLLSGITRVARARLHNRRGPGVLQEYRDIIKLLGRQSVGPDASGWVFRLTPYVMVGVMLTIATALPVVTVGSPLPHRGSDPAERLAGQKAAAPDGPAVEGDRTADVKTNSLRHRCTMPEGVFA